MKKIILFILLLSISKTFSQIEHELSPIIILKNKIHEVQVFNVNTSKDYLFEHFLYDSYGHIVKDILFNNNGTVWIKTSFQYNDEQQLVATLHEESGKSITKYKYDKSGNIIEWKTIESDSTVVYLKKAEYNEKNQKTKIFGKKKNNDDFYLEENNFYTNDGLLSKKEKFDESEKLISVEEFKYDRNRNLIFISRLLHGKKDTTNYKYNEKDELIKVEYPTGIFRKYKYDKFGNRIEEIAYDRNDRILQHREYKYKTFE